MDPVKTGLNPNGIPAANGPANPPVPNSILHRIKETAHNVLNKLDQIYDKASIWGRIGFLGGVALTAFILPIAGAPVLAIAVLVAGIGLFTLLAYRHKSFEANKNLQQYRPIEEELTKINQRVADAKFVAQIDSCKSSADLEKAISEIMNKYAEIKDAMEALALKLPAKNILLRDFKHHFKLLKTVSENPEYKTNWQEKQKDFKGYLETTQMYIKQELDCVRGIMALDKKQAS